MFWFVELYVPFIFTKGNNVQNQIDFWEISFVGENLSGRIFQAELLWEERPQTITNTRYSWNIPSFKEKFVVDDQLNIAMS